MSNLLQEAKAMAETIRADRHYLHEHAETEFDLTETRRYVFDALTKMGYTPEPCGKAGLVAQSKERSVISSKKSYIAITFMARMDPVSSDMKPQVTPKVSRLFMDSPIDNSSSFASSTESLSDRKTRLLRLFR